MLTASAGRGGARIGDPLDERERDCGGEERDADHRLPRHRFEHARGREATRGKRPVRPPEPVTAGRCARGFSVYKTVV